MILTFLFVNEIKSQTYIVTYAEKRILDTIAIEKLPEEIQEHKYELAKIPNLYSLTFSGERSSYTEINKSRTPKFYFKNMQTGEMIFQLFMGAERISGKDQLLDMKWKITDETEIIKGYESRKAISSWNGYSFTAWFTREISIDAGPDRFDGLPGLILKIEFGSTKIEVEEIFVQQSNTEVIQPSSLLATKTILEIDQYMKAKISGYENIGAGTLIKKI